MNKAEFQKFRADRKPSLSLMHFNVADLHCYGCAHSTGGQPFPSRPSGERPCCSCVRNKERESGDARSELQDTVEIGTDGHARIFNPFTGALYNGAPTVHFPQDNYVTLDQHEQQDWLDKHPEYRKAVRFAGDGKIEIVEQ